MREVDVLVPIAVLLLLGAFGCAVLMVREFIGAYRRPAPKLKSTEISRAEARKPA